MQVDLPILQDALDAIVGLREADVLVHHRFCIDRDVRCGQWYTVSAKVKLPSRRPPLKSALLFWVEFTSPTSTTPGQLNCLDVNRRG